MEETTVLAVTRDGRGGGVRGGVFRVSSCCVRQSSLRRRGVSHNSLRWGCWGGVGVGHGGWRWRDLGRIERKRCPSNRPLQSRGSCFILMGVFMDRLRRSSRHSTYSLNWDESTPPPHDAATLKPFWNSRSRTWTELSLQ